MRTKLIAISAMISLLTAVPVEAVKVFKVKSEGLANVKVYETNSEGLADCRIFVTRSEGLASGSAKWYFVGSEGLADVKVYFTESEGLADKKIYFVKSEGLARCDVDWSSYKKTSATGFCPEFSAGFVNLVIRDMVFAPCHQLKQESPINVEHLQHRPRSFHRLRWIFNPADGGWRVGQQYGPRSLLRPLRRTIVPFRAQ